MSWRLDTSYNLSDWTVVWYSSHLLVVVMVSVMVVIHQVCRLWPFIHSKCERTRIKQNQWAPSQLYQNQKHNWLYINNVGQFRQIHFALIITDHGRIAFATFISTLLKYPAGNIITRDHTRCKGLYMEWWDTSPYCMRIHRHCITKRLSNHPVFIRTNELVLYTIFLVMSLHLPVID